MKVYKIIRVMLAVDYGDRDIKTVEAYAHTKYAADEYANIARKLIEVRNEGGFVAIKVEAETLNFVD